MNNLIHMAFMMRAFLELSPLFNEPHTYNICLIKGECLSLQAYGKVGQRRYTDFDILISKNNIQNFETYLKSNGLQNTNNKRLERIVYLSSSHQMSPWIKDITPFGKIKLDLNFDIFWGEYEGKRINMDEFLSDTIEIQIYGKKVKTLPPIKALVQLILHHYKDMNSIFLLATRNSIKYEMFKDIYYLLKNNLDVISLDKLYAISTEYEIIPYVFYVLYYTGQIFEDDILKHYVEAFRNPKGEALLNCYGLCEKERKEWRCDFKARLVTDNLYELIKDDLTENDKEKILINEHIFMGVDE